MSDGYRMYKQAYDTLQENKVESYDVIQPFNKRVDKSGICPTLTTRPEGFKTCILVAVSHNTEPIFTAGGCVDCDECEHRLEECLCDISEDEEQCPLLNKDTSKSIYGKRFISSLNQYIGFCTNCNMAINSTDSFCSNCGNSLNWNERS